MNVQLNTGRNSLKLCFLDMKLPIFPLNGAVLFPGTSLPLNIFERRYLDMVNYSLSKDRLIGMIQSNKDGELFNVGCIGKIHSFNETEDGRYLISLQGTSCFKLNKELKVSYNFRVVEADIIKSENIEDIFSEFQKNSLLSRYKNYIKKKNIDLNLQEIENIETDQIIKFIAMVSPFKDIDKQALLETLNISDFYDKLQSILELELAGEVYNHKIN